MSEKKVITVSTQPQQVEIEGNVITNDELKQLWSNARGGNADMDNVELFRHLAVNVVNDKDMQRVLHYRAAMLEDALEQIRNFIWPKDQADKVLTFTPENKSGTAA